jgi:Big-like domain-containing protein/BACON domain-containing protein
MRIHASRPFRILLPAAAVLASIALFSSPLNAAVFQPVPALSFTKSFGGANPLAQNPTIAAVGAGFSFSITSATTTSGGSWLSASAITGCGVCATPLTISVSVNPSASLDVGTYTGQVVVTSQVGGVVLTIPVTLTIVTAGATIVDNLPGQLSFSQVTDSSNPPASQTIQIRNGGSGTLSWTGSTSTSDGGSWLIISSPGGTAPAFVTVGVVPRNLPAGGLLAGTFVGQILVQAPSGNVTIPVSVVIGNKIFSQVNPISFTKVFAGADPLPQTLTIASTGATFNYGVAAATATGGSWLSVSTITGCSSCPTPSTIQAMITTSPTLPAGTYTGQIVVTAQTGLSMTIPVTLTVATAGTAFFDNVPGQMSFSMQPGGATEGQSLQIRNAGTGTLDWTLEQSTADGGNWLTVSATSGVAPSYVTVGVNPANLPNRGLIGGTFVGNLLFQTAGSSVTVPVSVVLGANVFSQVNPISFTMPVGAANPLPQAIEMSSTGANFNFSVAASNANGGSWLSVSTAGLCEVCSTPNSLMAAINASPTLAAGTYTGQIVATAQTGFMSVTIPVTLTVTMANTTTAVTSSVNPSIFGQPVTFTATVSPVAPSTGTPTGTVSFFDGANPIPCIAAGTLASGVATCTTSSLPVASHTISTSYPGDANFIGSVGSLIGNPEVVTQASTSTTVTSSQNPQTAGQAVTFTATVSAVAPGTGTPTGTVTFLDGGSPIACTAPGTLSGGVATCTTSALAPGSHTITTSYSGDGNFLGSSGSLIGNPQVITQATVNVSSSVSVTSTGLSYNKIKQQGTETVTVKNTSAQSISGPVELVLGLSAGVTAVNNTGTFNGNPYWTVTAGSIAPGASAQVTVTLGYASGTTVSTSSSVYSGSLP